MIITVDTNDGFKLCEVTDIYVREQDGYHLEIGTTKDSFIYKLTHDHSVKFVEMRALHEDARQFILLFSEFALKMQLKKFLDNYKNFIKFHLEFNDIEFTDNIHEGGVMECE